MTTLSVQVKGAELTKKNLEDLAAEIPQISAGRIFGRMTAAKVKLKRYPPQTNLAQPFKTEKQRKFFFAALREGRIKVPYQRTRTLAEGWSVARTQNRSRSSDGYSLSNPTDYTSKVHGDGYGVGQVAYHRGNWPVARDVVDAEIVKLPSEIEENIRQVARRKNL
jgi:hypothetical protein